MLEGLASNDLRAAYTNAVIAHPFGIVGGVDRLFTGRVERVDTEFLNQLLDKGVIPVIAPLGFDGDGRTFRVNSDGVALEVAEALKASKLIFVTNRNGFTKNGKKATPDFRRRGGGIFQEAQGRDSRQHGLQVRAQHPRLPQRRQPGPRHRRPGRRGAADRDLLQRRRRHDDLRQRVPGRAARDEEGRPGHPQPHPRIGRAGGNRQADAAHDILSQLNDYYVFQIDGNIVGCVALHVQPDGETAELACLSVSGAHENMGIGQKLMTFAEDAAKQKGVKSIFLLSTRAFNYFQQKGGYKEGSPDDLPPARREKYDSSGRNSKVLVKPVG